jgi:hypothetical protein
MKVKVTQEHIREGRAGFATCCPVALALKELGCEWAVVGTTDIRVLFEGEVIRKPLPDKVTNFIRAFDFNHPVDPMEFEL